MTCGRKPSRSSGRAGPGRGEWGHVCLGGGVGVGVQCGGGSLEEDPCGSSLGVVVRGGGVGVRCMRVGARRPS